MEEQDQFTPSMEYFGATSSAATSSSPVQVDGDENIEDFPLVHGDDGEGPRGVIFNSWSCIVTVLAFWFVVSLTLIFGVYGSVNVKLGPNSSILIKPNRLFVDSVRVEELDGRKLGPIVLYGFYKDPSLDVSTTWSETSKIILPAGNRKEFMYLLNEGSQINISYSMNYLLSSALILVIAEGNEGLAKWLEDPSHPNTTLSWNTIQGNGMIQQEFHKSSNYYIAIGNLNFEVVEVKLSIRIKALLYNTRSAYYECTLFQGQCTMELDLCVENVALLTSPDQKSVMESGYWNVKISYGPRWMTYLVGIFGMTVFVLLVSLFFNHLPCIDQDERSDRFGNIVAQRMPLLLQKDGDLSNLGSSYNSISDDEQYGEDGQSGISMDAKQDLDRERDNNIRFLCVICFDAPRECFFLPCGHCVACFACITRIAEATKSCPICHRQVKKVRKIFMV